MILPPGRPSPFLLCFNCQDTAAFDVNIVCHMQEMKSKMKSNIPSLVRCFVLEYHVVNVSMKDLAKF